MSSSVVRRLRELIRQAQLALVLSASGVPQGITRNSAHSAADRMNLRARGCGQTNSVKSTCREIVSKVWHRRADTAELEGITASVYELVQAFISIVLVAPLICVLLVHNGKTNGDRHKVAMEWRQ